MVFSESGLLSCWILKTAFTGTFKALHIAAALLSEIGSPLLATLIVVSDTPESSESFFCVSPAVLTCSLMSVIGNALVPFLNPD